MILLRCEEATYDFRIRTPGRKGACRGELKEGALRSGGTAGAMFTNLFLVSFFVRSEGRFFVPTRVRSQTARADAVKAGRRRTIAAGSSIARPRLDGGEHGVTLRTVGTSTISTPCAL